MTGTGECQRGERYTEVDGRGKSRNSARVFSAEWLGTGEGT